MLTTSDAIDRILDRTRPLPVTSTALNETCGHFLAEPIVASLSLPRFDQSSMDGYAVSLQDCGAGTVGRNLSIVGETAAGEESTISVGAGNAVRIFTGAPVPPNTGAVIMQEDVTKDGPTSVIVNAEAEPGEFIRRAGADLCEGQKLASTGQRISPQLVALLATQGLADVKTGTVPRIGILSTGDELTPVGTPLASPAAIYNSNGPMLQALAAQAGARCPHVLHSRDDFDSIVAALGELSSCCDIVIISGGVSVGDHDHVRPAMERAGFAMDFWKVKMKPGKPLAFGTSEQALAFGLPGNPVSAFVTFWLFVSPAIRKLAGAGPDSLHLPQISAQATADINNTGNRPHWFRGTVDRNSFQPLGLQESHALFSLSKANALACVAEQTSVTAGDRIDAMLLPGS